MKGFFITFEGTEGSGKTTVIEKVEEYYISKGFHIPCAHAPAFKSVDISSNIVDSKCAAEFITPTFLPCVLLGFSGLFL